jgi:hypothetical protein
MKILKEDLKYLLVILAQPFPSNSYNSICADDKFALEIL